MAHQVIQTRPRSVDNEVEGNNHEFGTSLVSWCRQNGFDQNVMIELTKNGVESLADLKVLETDQDIKEFVDTLSIKQFLIKRKLIKAIKAIQIEEEKEQTQQS